MLQDMISFIKPARFQWRDRTGVFHNPKDMETRHLFFTIRMIWNHSAPEYMRIKPYNKYSFGDFYTREYMRDAVKFLAKELGTRKDASVYYTSCIENMLKYLDTVYKVKQIK